MVICMIVKRIVVGSLKENCYVVINEKQEALIIDPGDEVERILDFVGDYSVVGILVTHFHFDHVGALGQLEQFFSLKANCVKEHHFTYETILTPGHTKDSVSFYFPEISAVFVGDFIFERGIGRTDLGGNEKDMISSLNSFLNRFSDEILLYPGHGNSTTLGQERKFLEYIKEHF